MRTSFTYFDTEVTIGAPDVVRFTSLKKLGIDQDRMISEFMPSFWRLQPDIYDAQREKMRFLMERAGHQACQCPQLKRKFVQYYANELKLDDFHEIADNLRRELREHGKIKSDRQWDEIQVGFLKMHKYFTKTAIETRREKKLQHLKEVEERLKRDEYAD